ncbi:MAG: radical SAM protein [Candidatus Shapirobacteria bacterium]|jgi:radical SAM superfamily enzyme YgiQ (UPF0313 family)
MQKNKKDQSILIANSVGMDEAGNKYIVFPSRWSAKVGKYRSFCFYPYELAYLSTLLKKDDRYQVVMVDGNYEALSWKEYFEKYKNVRPDYLVMETSSVVYQDDLKFALAFKKKFKTKLIFCGQHPTAYPLQVIEDGVDFVCLGEYEMTVLDIIRGKKKSDIAGVYPNKRRELLDINSLPFPEDEDIARINYSNIGGCDYREIEFFASRGCKMNCTFCVARQAYYDKPNFRERNINSIIEEIKYLKNKYPQMEGVFFDEENHNTSVDFVYRLCASIKENSLEKLKYDAMCGYWTLDEKVMKEMKSAGYYKIRIGVESVGRQTGLGMKKNINVERMLEVLRKAKMLGIRMYGTFTFGAMGSTLKEDKETIKFLSKLIDEGLMYDFQTSICTPQPGTPFFAYLEEKKYLKTKDWDKYDGNTAVFEYPDYSKEEIESNVAAAYFLYVRAMLRNRGLARLFWEQFRIGGLGGLGSKILAFLKTKMAYRKYM